MESNPPAQSMETPQAVKSPVVQGLASPALPPLPPSPAQPSSPAVPAAAAAPVPSTSAALNITSISDIPLSPLPHHLAPFLLPSSTLSAQDKRELFTSTYLRSASSGNADTLEWLLSVPDAPSTSARTAAAARRFSASSLSAHSPNSSLSGGIAEILPDNAPRKWVDVEATDEDGNTALGMSVALGHAEGVRVLVEGGASVAAGDRAGWTPLHWAVQNNDVPIAAYLLNHRASTSIASQKGLTPKDLVSRGHEGLAMREVLKSAEEAALSRERLDFFNEQDEDDEIEGKGKGRGRDSARGPSSRDSSVVSERRRWADAPDKLEEEARERELQKRMELARLSAVNLEVDLTILSLEDRGHGPNPEDDEEDADEEEENPFVWNKCLPDQMLVFTLDDLPIIFDVVITNMKPVRARKFRVTPANVIFLLARFAHYFASSDILEELFLSAIERIESAIHNRPDDMTNCAFWLSNCLLLLYYLRKEPNLVQSTADYQVHLCDLINEIFVFIIRDAERRIDRILEAAVLEHDALPGFEDVQFEGDWASTRFVKKLTGRGKKSLVKSTSAKSLFAETLSGASSPGGSTTGVPGPDVNPRSITSLLSSTLFILQLYEIPPSIIVQAFSQLFYWISCEIFNRLLIQKKFLCRSKALQIRMNATTLEDWARLNRMPSKMVSVHFAPLNQLLQWLQCLSSESSIDGLIGTIQSLRSLNPLQLRRAVREYRYEVDEPKMGEDCEQYLLQIQKQWERLRVQKTVEEVQSSAESVRSSSPTESNLSIQSDVVRMIDQVFSDPSSFGHYTPPGGSEALGELLNSRYMLPFAVPSSADMLVNLKSRDAFGPFAESSLLAPGQSGGVTPRSVGDSSSPSSINVTNGSASQFRRSSVASSVFSQMSDDEPKYLPTPVLPDEFFAVLDAAKAEAAYHQVTTTRRGDGLGLDSDSHMQVPTTPLASAAPGNGWYNWRDHMPGDEEVDEEDEGDEDGDAGVEATPRPPTGGFQRSRIST